MRTSHFKWFAIIVFAMMTACSAAEKSSFGEDGTTDESSEAPATDGSPLYLYLQTKYESADIYSTFDTCIIASTVSAGTADSTKDCTFSVPEVQMYYSDLKIVIGTNSSTTCKLISFTPYHFLRSIDPAFLETADGVSTDCSPGKYGSNADCWGGAAVGFLGSSFPQSRGKYFLAEDKIEENYTSLSANKLRLANGFDAHYRTNRVVANNLADTATGVSVFGTHYISNSMVDYSATCQDELGYVKYRINLLIEDDDGDATSDPDGTINDITDWD
jgi:hypothetical protein